MRLLLDRDQKERRNQPLIEEHHPENTALVREQLRCAASYEGSNWTIVGQFSRVGVALFVHWANRQPRVRDRTYPVYPASLQALTGGRI